MVNFRRIDGCTVEDRASLEISNGVVIQAKLDSFSQTGLASKVVTRTQIELVIIVNS